MEGGRLVSAQPETMISSLNTLSTSKKSPIQTSQTFSLSSPVVKKESPQKVPLAKKGNVSLESRPTVKVMKGSIQNKKELSNKVDISPSNKLRGCAIKESAQLNLKRKGGNESNVQRKILKPERLTDENSLVKPLSELPNFLDRSNFKSQGDLIKETSKICSESGSSTPEYIYDQLDDTDVENFDHEYNQVEDGSREDLIEESNEDMIEDLHKTVENTYDEVPFPCTSKSVYIGEAALNKSYQVSSLKQRPGVNDKFPEISVPVHMNQYGDCLKTRLGKCHYGMTLSDPPCQFFQGVLKGASGQTLAVMFGDLNLLAKLESIPLDEIGNFVIDTTFKVIPNGTEGVNRVFTISLLHQNMVIPVWYALTSCSSLEVYKRIIIEFQQHVLDWPFISVLVNNDPALCKALRTIFPDVDLYGSWFHYCYGIWKELNLHNLVELCKAENASLLLAVKLLMVVPYLPPSTTNNSSITMADGFEYVREVAKKNNLPKEFNKVLNYVSVFWFNKVKPENFTLFGKHTCPLNHVEVLQLLLLSYMKENETIWTLTRSFQFIAKSTLTDYVNFLNGKRIKSKKKRGKKFTSLILMNNKKLMAGSLDVKSFMEKSLLYLEEILDIFLHPLYPNTIFEKENYIHTEGWTVRIC